MRINSNGILGIDLETLESKSLQEESQNPFLNQAGIWIVAKDINGNIYSSVQHVKALDSFDFWPGPVDTLTGQTGSFEKWNYAWPVSKAQIENHKISYNQNDYVIPDEILNWPVESENGFNKYLAPFVDFNNNEVYDPENGDYPKIHGVNAVYCIFNDLADEHTASLGIEMGLEVHMMAYTLENSSTIFLEYYIISRKSIAFQDVKVGFFLGGECGNPEDNYSGTFSEFPQTTFIYNGDSNDDNFFGSNLPYVYATFLNENLEGSIAFNQEKTDINGLPIISVDYYNFLNTKWKDGSSLTFGNDGISGSNPYPYIFDNSSSPSWNESGNTDVGNRSILGITSVGEMNKNDFVKLNIAIGAGTTSNSTSLIENIKTLATKDNEMYKTSSNTSQHSKRSDIRVYPNPSSGEFTISNVLLDSKIYIYDYQGVMLHSQDIQKKSNTTCNIKLHSGIYILELVNSNGTQIKKLSITH